MTDKAVLLHGMNTPTTYSIRAGTIDSGRDYEIKMAALLLLRCLNHAKTKNAWLAMNVDYCGAFDDVVLYKQAQDGKEAIYLIQLKHEDKGSNIKAEELKTKKDSPVLLAKYFESITEIKELVQKWNLQSEDPEDVIDHICRNRYKIVFVLFTNRGTTTGCDFLKSVAKGSNLDNDWMLYDTINTTTNGTIFEIDYYKLGNNNQYFEENFFLSTKQAHVTKMNAELMKSIETLIKPAKIAPNLLSDVLLKFLQYFSDWSKGNLGGYYPLAKSHIVKKLTELLLDPYMATLETDLTHPGFQHDVWTNIIEDQDVTVINETDKFVSQFIRDETCSALKVYCDNSETKSWWSANVGMIRETVGTTRITTEQIYSPQAYYYLWKIGRIPLLLEVDDFQSAKQVQDILKFSRGTVRVLVLNKTDSFVEKVAGLKVFSNIGALDKNQREAILRHPVTLQGKTSSPVCLLNLVGAGFKHVTVKDIIYILSGRFNIGNELQPLCHFYEEMSVTKVWLKLSALVEVKDEVFVVKCTNPNSFQKCIENCLSNINNLQVLLWKNGKANSPVKVILFDKDEHLNKIEGYCLKTQKPFHLVVFHDSVHLEWIKSYGSINNVKPFRKVLANQVKMTNNLVNEIVKHKKSTLISSQSGMGKSVLINYLAHHVPSSFWALKINLAEHSDEYRKWESEAPSMELLSLFADKILNKQKCLGQLVKATFRKYFDSKKVLFLLDGFDEIQFHYHVGAKKIVKCIRDAGFTICLTTRPLLQPEVESLINTFSVTLNPFTKVNQTHFLRNCFSEATGVVNSDSRVESFVDRLLTATKHNLNDRDNEFAGVPLQTTLLAEVFANDCEKFLKTNTFVNKRFDLLYLYKSFIQKKVDIALKKIEKITEDMIDQYKICRAFYSLSLVFPESCLKSLGIAEKLKQAHELFPLMVQLIQKDGIVVADSENNVSFVHRTFAEYLSAEWLSENLQGKHKELVKDLLKESFHPRFEIVRNIFDRILAKDCLLHLAIINRRVDEVEEIMSVDADAFRRTDKGRRTFLHLIASWGLHHPPASYTASDMEIYKLRRLAAHDDMVKIVKLIPNSQLMESSEDDILEYTPLDYAFASGALFIANELCTKRMYYFPLIKMVNDHSIVDYIGKMNYLALINAFTSYKFEFDNLRFARMCSSRPEGLQISAMHCAAQVGDIEEIIANIANEEMVNKVDVFTGQTPLHVAVISGQTEIVLLLLSSRANPNIQDCLLRTPLHWALCRNTKGVDIHLRDKYGDTALTMAAYKGYTNVVKLLLSQGADKEVKDRFGATALLVATTNGHADVVEVLLSQGADTDAKNNVGSTALVLAAVYGYVTIANLLLSHGTNIEASNNYESTALIIGAQFGHTDIVDLLLTHGANIEAKNSSGNNAMLLAASYGHPDILKLLLSRGADKNAVNNDGNNALMLVAMRPYGDTEVANILLSEGFDMGATNKEGSTALIIAALNGHINTLKLLLSKDSNKGAKCEQGNTALAVAAYNGRTDLVKLLVQDGFDKEARNMYGYTPLILAACSGQTDVIRVLLACGSELEARSNEGVTALIGAANNGRLNAVKLLIAKGSSVEDKTNGDDTVLMVAAIRGHPDIVELILAYGVDKNLRNDIGDTALARAARFGHTKVVNLLLAQGADTEIRNNSGSTALATAAFNGHSEIVSLLLSHGAEKEARTDVGDTALILAANKGHLDVVTLLLTEGSDKEATSNDGSTALSSAAFNRHTNVLSLLLSYGVKTETKSSAGNTPLILAAFRGHLEIVKLLIAHGADKEAKNNDGDNALTLSSLHGCTDVVSFFLTEGLDKDDSCKIGNTALISAICNGHTETINLLLSHGVDTSLRNDSGNTALIVAARNGHTNLVDLLLSRGLDIETRNNLGGTALTTAAFHGHSEIIGLLLSKGANIEARNNVGDTPLTLAAHKGHVEAVELLLLQGANINARQNTGDTALNLAAYQGHVALVNLLLSKGADKESKAQDGITPFISAAFKGHVEAARLLLSQGANKEATITRGDTALILAAREGHADMVDLLLSEGLDKDATATDGNTALISAAFNGKTSTVALLLSHGVRKDARTSKGNTALSSAAIKGYNDVVDLLLRHGSDKEARSNSGDTALLLAAVNGHLETVELLLANGCDKKARNNEGDDALMCAERAGHVDISLLLSTNVE